MNTNDKTLANVQPGGRVRLGDQAERARFEKWMTDVAKIIVGSSDPYPAGLERDYWRVWQAALSAQPCPGGQGDALLKLKAAWMKEANERFQGNEFSVVAERLYICVNELEAALAARQPVGRSMGSDLSGYAVAASQVRRGYDVECERCGKFCDEGPGPCQSVGDVEQQARELFAAEMRRDGFADAAAWIQDPAKTLRHIEAEAIRAIGVALTIPAQAVDLGQIIEQIAQQWDGCSYDAVGETIDVGQAIRAAGERLIDSQAVGK